MLARRPMPSAAGSVWSWISSAATRSTTTRSANAPTIMSRNTRSMLGNDPCRRPVPGKSAPAKAICIRGTRHRSRTGRASAGAVQTGDQTEKWAACDGKRPKSREETPKSGLRQRKARHHETGCVVAPGKVQGWNFTPRRKAGNTAPSEAKEPCPGHGGLEF